jgi:hypothetical protein
LEGGSSEESELNAMPTMIEWAAPFSELFPMLPGPDDLFAQAQMIEIAERSGSNVQQALGDARVASGDWISEGRTTEFFAWLEPIIETEGEEAALFAAETRYNLLADRLEQGLNSTEWQEVLGRPMPIRRAWGVTGLCWALLLDQLENQRSYRHCERCARLIQGRRNKRFCGQSDNPDCFRARRAEDRRRGRNRQRG